MKKKLKFIYLIFLIVLIFMSYKTYKIYSKNNTTRYEEIQFDNYLFSINLDYRYEYDYDNKMGTLKDSNFGYSSIYISNKNYEELITFSSNYTNSGSKELENDITETSFKNYPTYISTKKVYYSDINKIYNLNTILINLEENKTLVFIFEVKNIDQNGLYLQDIKAQLANIIKQ